MDLVYLVAGMALVTFSIRYVLLALSGRVRLSAAMQRALAYVPPTVLTAIIVPAALIPNGETLNFSWTNPYLIGALLTVLIGRLSRNLLATIAGGMLLFVSYQWLLHRGIF